MKCYSNTAITKLTTLNTNFKRIKLNIKLNTKLSTKLYTKLKHIHTQYQIPSQIQTL